MKTISILMVPIIFGIFLVSCSGKTSTPEKTESPVSVELKEEQPVLDQRISLNLNQRQKQHQLKNMRSHLEAVQTIVGLLAAEEYDEASEVAYTKLGSTTEMKLMCASFGNENFEKLGLGFHSSADKMSEIFKKRDRAEALEALSNTINYCVQCHALYRQ